MDDVHGQRRMGGAEAPLVVSGTADVAGEPQPAAVELLVAVGADTTKFVDFFCIAAILPMSFGQNDDTMLASSSCDRHTERYAPAIISSTVDEIIAGAYLSVSALTTQVRSV